MAKEAERAGVLLRVREKLMSSPAKDLMIAFDEPLLTLERKKQYSLEGIYREYPEGLTGSRQDFWRLFRETPNITFAGLAEKIMTDIWPKVSDSPALPVCYLIELIWSLDLGKLEATEEEVYAEAGSIIALTAKKLTAGQQEINYLVLLGKNLAHAFAARKIFAEDVIPMRKLKGYGLYDGEKWLAMVAAEAEKLTRACVDALGGGEKFAPAAVLFMAEFEGTMCNISKKSHFIPPQVKTDEWLATRTSGVDLWKEATGYDDYHILAITECLTKPPLRFFSADIDTVRKANVLPGVDSFMLADLREKAQSQSFKAIVMELMKQARESEDDKLGVKILVLLNMLDAKELYGRLPKDPELLYRLSVMVVADAADGLGYDFLLDNRAFGKILAANEPDGLKIDYRAMLGMSRVEAGRRFGEIDRLRGEYERIPIVSQINRFLTEYRRMRVVTES